MVREDLTNVMYRDFDDWDMFQSQYYDDEEKDMAQSNDNKVDEDNDPTLTVDFIKPLSARFSFTPDFREIKNRSNILVFIYSDLKEDLFGAEFFDNKDIYLGKGRTVATSFRMKISSTGLPVVTKGGLYGSRAIMGDIYAVSAAKLMQLDCIEQNTIFTHREKEYVYAEDQILKNNKIMPSLPCWMYLHPHNHGLDVSESIAVKETRAAVPSSPASTCPLTQEYSPLA